MESIQLAALFAEGLLSFLSPCVLPIIPIYLGILSGKREFNKNGNQIFNKKNTVINSLFFVTGIALTFFIIAFTTSNISIFFNTNINTIQYISGILIIFMGLLQVGFIKLNFLKQEFSFKRKIKTKQATPLIALLMGFTFSFSWTPCIGPILASVFLYASSHTGIYSYILVVVYALGFILPFIVVALFASRLLTLLKEKQNLLKYTTIISGIILILIGISILTGSFAEIAFKLVS